MAKALYNSLTHSNDADSAGTYVKEEGQRLSEIDQISGSSNFHVLDVMKELGIDISSEIRTKVTPEMINKYDKIISMAEENETPEWLIKSPKYTHWYIKDPGGQSYDVFTKTRDEIRYRVTELINSEA
jgi:protein-tyrosine-phosphatase